MSARETTSAELARMVLARPEGRRFVGLKDCTDWPAEGFVYFILAHGHGREWLKVGFTKGDPGKRLRALQTGCPLPLSLAGFVLGSPDYEQELHCVLERYRVRGEWFAFEQYPALIVSSECQGLAFLPDQEREAA